MKKTHEELENLVRVRKLKKEPPSAVEIAGLVRSGLARLGDAGNTSLSFESRFDLAYNAAHALSLAALRWHGYRSDHRFIVFQCLQHTIDLPSEQWRVLDQAHRKRNIAEYEGYLEVEEPLVEALNSRSNIRNRHASFSMRLHSISKSVINASIES